MIYYFSGTGNSLDAARQLAGPEEAVISMASLPPKGAVYVSPAEGEAVGFVFPVYYGGLPSLVREFVARLTFTRYPSYIYAVITCGAKVYAAPAQLDRALRRRGESLSAAFSVVMPDNYVVMFTLDSEEKRADQLAAARDSLREIRRRILARERVSVAGSPLDRAMTAAMLPAYEAVRHTRPFWVDDQCIGCAACVRRCPVQAMAMKEGRPVWIKDRCVHCMACARCGAIQYGKTTVGKKRYTNPVLKSGHHHHG